MKFFTKIKNNNKIITKIISNFSYKIESVSLLHKKKCVFIIGLFLGQFSKVPFLIFTENLRVAKREIRKLLIYNDSSLTLANETHSEIHLNIAIFISRDFP